MSRCSVCQHPEVKEIDVLLAAGASVRSVAQMKGIPRTTLGRHKQHAHTLDRRFGLIRGDGGPNGHHDPLAEAVALAARARTPRQKLRGLEQVRAATKLKLRGVDLDPADRELLEDNIRQAEAAYRSAGDFETQARALSGWREAVAQRLDAVKAPPIEVPMQVEFHDGEPDGPGTEVRMTAASYWRRVPTRFRNERYAVSRRVQFSFDTTAAGEEVRVYEIETGALVWSASEG